MKRQMLKEVAVVGPVRPITVELFAVSIQQGRMQTVQIARRGACEVVLKVVELNHAVRRLAACADERAPAEHRDQLVGTTSVEAAGASPQWHDRSFRDRRSFGKDRELEIVSCEAGIFALQCINADL